MKEDYLELKNNPPKLQVQKEAKEVIFTTISCMCNNKHFLKLKKNSEGEFKLSGFNYAISNWQMKFEQHDIEWEADTGRWDNVISMINSGTSQISDVKSR